MMEQGIAHVRLLYATVFLAVAVSSEAVHGAPGDSTNDSMPAGIRKMYDDQLRVIPKTAGDYIRRAEAHMAYQQYDLAIEDYSKAIPLAEASKDGSSDSAYICYLNRAGLYRDQRQYQKAINDYTKASEAIRPGILPREVICFFSSDSAYAFASPLDERGNLYADLKNYQNAIEDYSKAISIHRNFAKAFFDRALIYAKLGQYQKAVDDCSKAISIKWKFLDAYRCRVECYEKLGQQSLADEDRKKIAELLKTGERD